MKMSLVSILLTALVVAVIFPAGASAYRLDEVWEKSFEVEDGVYFDLANINGSITVEGWDRGEIEVTAEIRIKAPSKDRARKLFRKIDFDVETGNGKVRIRADLPKLSRGRFGWFGDSNESIRVAYTVRVPHETDLDLESVNGRIEVDRVGGVFNVKTVNGGIALRMLGGEGNIKTVNGGIDCYLKDFPYGGELNAKTVNGGVELELPDEIDAELDLKTSNGRIRVGFDLDDARTLKKRRVRAAIGRGEGLIHVRTLNGGIRIDPF